MINDIKEIISVPHDEKDSNPTIKSCCDFAFNKKIGEGTFGTVYVATNIQTNEKVAIKKIEKARIVQLEERTRVEREIKILKSIRHSNIVHLYCSIITEETIYLITEYIKGKELFDYIIEKKRLSENEACNFYQQIISGIEYLHKQNVIHRDIKPENLLINVKTKELKIVDFGLSNWFNTNKGHLLKSSCGSPCYAAPEMLDGKEYKAEPIDIWSSGITLYAMLCGYLPFEDDNNEELYNKICDGKFTIPEFVSDDAKDLIRKILNTDPKKRITINQIKRHQWFNINNPSINMKEGLSINQVVIPIDEGIINEMAEKLKFDKLEEIRSCILSNEHNDISTIYYLLVGKKVRMGKQSVSDLKSSLYLKYIRNRGNLLENYNCDIKKVIKERKRGMKNDKYINNYKMPQSVKSVDSIFTMPNEKRSPRFKGENSKCNSAIKIGKIKRYFKRNINSLKGDTSPSKETLQIQSINLTEKFDTSTMIKKNNRLNTCKGESHHKALSTLITEGNYYFKKKAIFSPINIIAKRRSIKQVSPSRVEERKKKENQFSHMKIKTSPLFQKSNFLQFIEENNEKNFICDLGCIVFKTKKELKDNIISLLKKRKIKCRYSKKFIIESMKNNIQLEINIESLEGSTDYCVLQFKRILGPLDAYIKISRNIIEKLNNDIYLK